MRVLKSPHNEAMEVTRIENKRFDVVIIGGGPAGLSAALTLGRARRSIVLIDDDNPRNKMVHKSHGYLTRDGIDPTEFRKLAKTELARHPNILIKKDYVQEVFKSNQGFELTTKGGQHFFTRKLLMATGLRDELPQIEGLRDVYGISAFICPYCDGFEFRDSTIAILGHKLADIHFVKALYGWSHDIVLFTNGPHQFEKRQIEEFGAHHINIYEEKVQLIEHKEGVLQAVTLEKGSRIPLKGIFLNPEIKQASTIAEALGVPIDKFGIYQTKDNGETQVDGLYLAGDCRNHLHQNIHAVSDGAKAAVSINMALLKEDWHQP